MELSGSKSLQNLMRAFSGETQAWARYAFAESAARTQGFPILGELFHYTAQQEKEHAEVLWHLLQGAGVPEADASGSYPVDVRGDVHSLLTQAVAHEYREADTVYPSFAAAAEEEGFAPIAQKLRALAAIERVHAQRFERIARLLEQDRLFREDRPMSWICLHCGHVVSAAEPPAVCPVCSHEQGGFLRLELSIFQ